MKFRGNRFGGRSPGGRENNNGRGFVNFRAPQQNQINNSNHINRRGHEIFILDYPHGSNPNIGVLVKWLICYGIKIGIECPKSGIASIVKNDGTIGKYPEYTPPELNEEENASAIQSVKARAEYGVLFKSYNEKIEQLRTDKRLSTNIALTYMTSTLYGKIRESDRGRKALKDNDPIFLIEVLYEIFNADKLLEKAEIVLTAESRLINIEQGQTETLLEYYERTLALEEALKSAYSANGENAKKRMGTDKTRAIRFIKGLNLKFSRLKEDFRGGTVETYPNTLDEAYARAQRAQNTENSNRNWRGAFSAGRDYNGRNGGRQGRGKYGNYNNNYYNQNNYNRDNNYNNNNNYYERNNNHNKYNHHSNYNRYNNYGRGKGRYNYHNSNNNNYDNNSYNNHTSDEEIIDSSVKFTENGKIDKLKKN